MIDRIGRRIDYIRISLTDRCNLRCIYCMPEDGISQTTHNSILTYDEIIRICSIMAENGLKKVKLTGGEPLVRKNCAELLRRLKQIPGIEEVTLTTNGVLLSEQMAELVDAGLDAVNISLDTLDAEAFQNITRRDHLKQVLEGLETALQYPQIIIKLNCVPIVQDSRNLAELAAFAKKYPIHVRFIEMMPLGQGKDFSCIQEAEMLQILERAYGPAVPCEENLGNGPAHYYSFEGFQSKIGFISAVTHKFCAQCNRLRLTADGFLKACLQYQVGKDLKVPLREGCSDEELRKIIQEVLDKKPDGHHFSERQDEDETDEVRIMSQIGG